MFVKLLNMKLKLIFDTETPSRLKPHLNRADECRRNLDESALTIPQFHLLRAVRHKAEV